MQFFNISKMEQLIEYVKKVAQMEIVEAIYEEVCKNQNFWLKWKKIKS